MDQCPTTDDLRKLFLDGPAGPRMHTVEAHIETCAACQQNLDRMMADTRWAGPRSPAANDCPRFLRDLMESPPCPRNVDTLPAPLGRQPELAGFEVIECLGRGGMGVVYKAWQHGLHRLVALKMIQAAVPDAAALTRFRIEAEALARVQHPNIVGVYEFSTCPDGPFLVLEYVPDGSLADRLKGQPQPPAIAAGLIETLARAIHEAHRRGILHRDLKPANILLQRVEDAGAKDERNGPQANADAALPLSAFQPKITDFGLAKLVIGGVDQTDTGVALGTPSYMAPEQAGQGGNEIGPATDIFALGAVLYEMLTGRPPFRGESVAATLHQVLFLDPVPPRRLQPGVPRDLETIGLKCLEKSPSKRYSTAQELADDLARFQKLEPIRARRASAWQRAGKWARRHPAAAALVLVSALAGAALLGGGTWYQYHLEKAYREVEGQRDEAQSARAEADLRRMEAEKERDQARSNLYLSHIPRAYQVWQSANVARAREMLAELVPAPHQADLRGFEWHYLWRLCNADHRTLKGHEGPVKTVAVSPDGKRLASAGVDRKIRIWDAADGREMSVFAEQTHEVTSLAFSPGSDLLASAAADGTVLIWDVARGEVLRPLSGHTDWVYGVTFNADGKRLATAGASGTIRVWDAATGAVVKQLTGHEKTRVTAIAFHPDGKRLASGGDDRMILLWDLELGKPTAAPLRGHTGWVYSLSFRSDGQQLASASFDGTARIWDLEKGSELHSLAHGDQVRGVTFSPDDKWIFSASFDQTVRVWNAATGAQGMVLRGHVGHVNAVAADPQGRFLASAGADATVMLWDPLWMTGRSLATSPMRGHEDAALTVAFSPDGRLVASGSIDRTIRLWNADNGSLTKTLRGHSGRVTAVAFAPAAHLLASASADKTVRIWNLETETGQIVQRESERVNSVAISPDGKLLAWACFNGTISVKSVNGEQKPTTFAAHNAQTLAIAFSRDGQRIASAGSDKLVKVWDVTGRELWTLKGHSGWVYAVAFSSDGKWVASAGAGGAAKLWDASTGKERFTLSNHANRVTGLSFSPDSRRLATCSLDETVRIWDLASGQELLTLPNDDRAHAIAFAPVGQRLITAGQDGTLRLFNGTPIPSDKR